MIIKNTYAPAKRGFDRKQMLRIWRWPFLAAGFAAPVVNLAVGGKSWSLVALWGLYILWTNVFSLNMVGYNRVSQGLKISLQACVLLFLIDVCLAPGWALFVVPIVGFGALLTVAVLFFSDLRRQKANVMPLLLTTAVLLTLCAAGNWIWTVWSWPMIVLCAVSLGLVVACTAVMGDAISSSLRKYFHLK